MPDTQKGFTLLEVLIALVVVGAAMASLLALLSGSYRQEAHTDRVMQAWRIGERVMMEGILFPKEGLAQQGADGEYQWTREVVRDEQSSAVWLTVDVSWGKGVDRGSRQYHMPVPATYLQMP